MVASLQASTHPNLTNDTLDVQWRKMQGVDGIRQDYNGTAFAATLSTSAPTISIASAGRSVLVDGNLLDFTTDAVLDPRDTGTPPIGSQSRLDLVVARYNGAVEVLKDRGTLAIKPGTPATTPSPPAVSRSHIPGQVFELPLFQYRMPATGLLTDLVRKRVWSGGDPITLDDAADLSTVMRPIGTWARWKGSLWVRELVGTTATWVDAGTPALQTMTGGSAVSNPVAPNTTGTLMILPLTTAGLGRPRRGIMNVTLATKLVGGSPRSAGNVWCETSDTSGVRHAQQRWHYESTHTAIVVFQMRVPVSGADINLVVKGSVDAGAAPVIYGEPRVSLQNETTYGGL